MLSALGVPEKSECPDLSMLNTEGAYNPAAKFVERAMTYDGADALFKKDKPGEMMRFFARNPQCTAFSWETDGGKVRTFDYGAEGAAAIRGAIRHMFNLHVHRCLRGVKAKIDLVGVVEDVYNGNSRRKGKLTFSDFTKLSAAKEGSGRAIALANLEYRFDEKFGHWALDEFQDTSELQWACLRELVEAAAAPGGGRTVMAVGDLKQSIYTWRGGNDAPFKDMMSWGAFTDGEFGRIDDYSTSYRYEKNICDFINAVFGPENIRQSGVLPPERAKAIGRWLSADCWREHRADVDAGGRPKAGDYVKVLGVPDPEGRAKTGALLPALVDELKRVWGAHEASGSAESIGVLVRRNDEGNEIAERLRAEGMPVVWEGLSAVSDVPVVNALVDLLRLSEHPEDSFAWTTASRLFPICSTLFPQLRGAELGAAHVSRAVAASLSHQGLSRTLQGYCSALSEDSAGLDPLSKQRLREMVGVAVAYEQRNAGRFSIDGFEAFLAASSKREQGTSSRVVRILTIHRAKGLTLDRVFVPLAEGTAKWLADPGSRGLLYAGGDWALPSLPEDVAALNPETEKARNEMADDELLSNIRTYYVAMTRARKAMYVIVPLEAADASRPFFRDVVASAFAGFRRRTTDSGCEVVFEQGTEPEFRPSSDVSGSHVGSGRRPWRHDMPAEPVERVSPSSFGHRDFAALGLSASDLFSETAGEAAKTGVELHGQYAAIEWAGAKELAGLPPAFRAAFAKPGPEATVWRERSYEVYREGAGGGEWETGQFDRVVFTGEGAERRAVIYDFKTNAMKDGESAVAFERRMRRTYAPQMSAYRAALGALTGLPAGRIRSVLLLRSTGSAVECRNGEYLV